MLVLGVIAVGWHTLLWLYGRRVLMTFLMTWYDGGPTEDKVWIGFLYTLVSKVSFCFGIPSVSRRSVDPSGLV